MRARELKQARARLDLLQAKLAVLLGVTRETILRWEAGSNPVPKAIGLALRWLEATRKTT